MKKVTIKKITGEVALRKYDPKWIAYANAHKRTPSMQMLHDRRKYPKNPMYGYTKWTLNKWNRWTEERNFPLDMTITVEHFDEFAKWMVGESTTEK